MSVCSVHTFRLMKNKWIVTTRFMLKIHFRTNYTAFYIFYLWIFVDMIYGPFCLIYFDVLYETVRLWIRSHQIIMFGMVVYPVELCKQSIRSIKFTRPNAFIQLNFLYFNFLSQKIDCHCSCRFIYLFICLHFERMIQFTIYQLIILLLFMWKFKWIKMPNWFETKKNY